MQGAAQKHVGKEAGLETSPTIWQLWSWPLSSCLICGFICEMGMTAVPTLWGACAVWGEEKALFCCSMEEPIPVAGVTHVSATQQGSEEQLLRAVLCSHPQTPLLALAPSPGLQSTLGTAGSAAANSEAGLSNGFCRHSRPLLGSACHDSWHRGFGVWTLGKSQNGSQIMQQEKVIALSSSPWHRRPAPQA